jgi:hypothetical protein
VLRELVAVELAIEIGRREANRDLKRHQRTGLSTHDDIIRRYLLILKRQPRSVSGANSHGGVSRSLAADWRIVHALALLSEICGDV